MPVKPAQGAANPSPATQKTATTNPNPVCNNPSDQISITDANSSATIFYTKDGQPPDRTLTHADTLVYDEPFKVDTNREKINAIAVSQGQVVSQTAFDSAVCAPFRNFSLVKSPFVRTLIHDRRDRPSIHPTCLQKVTQMDKAARASRLRGMLEQVAPGGDIRAVAVPDKAGTTPANSGGLENFVIAPEETSSSIEKLSRQAFDDLSDSELFHLEAIVLPENRPAAFVHGDTYDNLPGYWQSLNGDLIKRRLGKMFAAIGRVEVPQYSLIPYAGTAFMVGTGLLMTNRHVAQIFSKGLGREIIYSSGDASVNFKRETGTNLDNRVANLTITKVELIHPYWDMALLRVEGDALPPALPLSTRPLQESVGRNVAVVGYPALDIRNDFALQNQIFGGQFNVKRLQPGVVRSPRQIKSFTNTVSALIHDASTLGGNSGSAVLDIETGEVVALHFAGEYLKANYAVPMIDLAQDSRLTSALRFTSSITPTNLYDAAWALTANEESSSHQGASAPAPPATSSAPYAAAIAPAGEIKLTVPLYITISLDPGPNLAPLGSVRYGSAPETSETEAVVVDQDYTDREGYDPEFLDGITVPLPGLTEELKQKTSIVSEDQQKHDDPHELTYHHYSIYMNKDRRTAWFSAANIDGKLRPAIGKREGDRWYADPRIPKTEQLNQSAFEHGIDRGHLTRREDTAWGRTVDSAMKANNDTFHFTNCALQASLFNRGKDRWQGLERFLLEEHAKKDKLRMTVITGPLFSPKDPSYRNQKMNYTVRCPLEFWKVCVLIREDGTPSATAFILGQDEIADLPGFEEAFDVGATQITVARLEKRTGLQFGSLKKHDHFASGGAPGTLESTGSSDEKMRVKVIRHREDIVI